MFDLDQLRKQKWHLDGTPVRTLDQAREFIESVGFCQMYPLKPPVLAPTFIGAWVGSEDHLPMWQMAFSDSRAQDATELMVRLLRDKSAFEANLFDENNAFLVAASIFPYFMRWSVSAILGRRRDPLPASNIRNWRAMPTRSFAATARSQNKSCCRIWQAD